MASIDYESLLTALSPYADKVAYVPLSSAEIDHLEDVAGHRFPSFYRDYLRLFGLLQDFVFGLLQTPADFKTTCAYLTKADKAHYIAIGDNGGEDCWLLRTDATELDNRLYECQHWNEQEIVPLEFSFADLLHTSCQQLRESYTNRLFNHQKSWHAEVSIYTSEEQKLLIALQATLQIPWEQTGISPANVTSFRSTISSPLGTYPLSRLEYPDWETPIYSFHLQDNFVQLQAGDSTIKKIDRILQNVFGKSYILVDYGLLPSDLLEDD